MGNADSSTREINKLRAKGFDELVIHVRAANEM
jgi:hypothetical protein